MRTDLQADSSPPFYSQGPREVLDRCRADAASGLSTADVDERRRRYGPNELRERQVAQPLKILAAQFTDLLIVVLMCAALTAAALGQGVEAVAIVVILILNAAIGFVQEYRAEQAVAALRRLAAPRAHVLREGTWAVLDARELVPGDIVRLEAGDAVPADVRLLNSFDLRIDESLLTGESTTVHKDAEAVLPAPIAIAEQINVAFKASLVTHGRAEGVVIATGMDTALGHVATLLSGAQREKTPLQKRLARFSRRLAGVVVAICAVVFAVGVARGEPAVSMLLIAVSLAVAAVPEALPAVVTVALALGAKRMAKRNALIRRLPAVETLGSVTYICADKTGTLTENRMHAEAFYDHSTGWGRLQSPQEVSADALFGAAIVLNNDAVRADAGQLQGDPTEVALFEAAEQAGWLRRELATRFPRMAELPFDAIRKRMSTLHQLADGSVVMFVKGAPEAVLPACANADDGGLPRIAEEKAGEGSRILAFACRHFEGMPDAVTVELEADLRFLGFSALIDPPRDHAAQAVRDCLSAGIVPVMITGDHPATARAIARKLGIIDHDARVISGTELAQFDDAALKAVVTDVRVYARVTPEQKIGIVRALQLQGEFVAMTGDGVNDAPALKQADIGVAMGLRGTEVAREAASMVLLDDHFATIVHAVQEGRRIYDNVRKFVKYTLTSNSGEIWTLFLAPLFGLPVPLQAVQILWINLMTDGLPGLALAVEQADKDVMTRPPRHPQESIFAHGLWQHALGVGLAIGLLSLAGQAWALAHQSPHWQTVVFTTLTFSQLVHAMVVRSESQSLWRLGWLSNPWLVGAVVLTVLLQLMVIYVPWLQPIFHTTALPPTELAVCFTLPWVILAIVEAEKYFRRRRSN